MGNTKKIWENIKVEKLEDNVIQNKRVGMALSTLVKIDNIDFLLVNNKNKLEFVDPNTFNVSKTVKLHNSTEDNTLEYALEQVNDKWYYAYATYRDSPYGENFLYIYNIISGEKLLLGTFSGFINDIKIVRIEEQLYVFVAYDADDLICLEKWNLDKRIKEEEIYSEAKKYVSINILDSKKGSLILLRAKSTIDSSESFVLLNSDLDPIREELSVAPLKGYTVAKVNDIHLLILTTTEDIIIYWDLLAEEELYSFPFDEQDKVINHHPLNIITDNNSDTHLIINGQTQTKTFNINKGGLPKIINLKLRDNSLLTSSYKNLPVLIPKSSEDSKDGIIWSIHSEKAIEEIAPPYPNYTIHSLIPYETTDNKDVFITGIDSEVIMWYLEGIAENIEKHIRIASFDLKGKGYFVTLTTHESLVLFDIQTGNKIQTVSDIDTRNLIDLKTVNLKGETILLVLYTDKIHTYSLPDLNKLPYCIETSDCYCYAFAEFEGKQHIIGSGGSVITTWDLESGLITHQPLNLITDRHTIDADGYESYGYVIHAIQQRGKDALLISPSDSEDLTYFWDMNPSLNVTEWDFLDEVVGNACEEYTSSYHIAKAVSTNINGKDIVVLALYAGAVAVFDTHTGKRRGRVINTNRDGVVDYLSIIKSDNTKILVTGDENGILKLFDLANNRLLQKHEYGTINSLATYENMIIVCHNGNITALEFNVSFDLQNQ